MVPTFLLAVAGLLASTAPGSTSPLLRRVDPPPRPFCVTCHIVDLSTVLGGRIEFMPTAINNSDQIVGYDGGGSGSAGTAYLIDSNYSFASFGKNQFLTFTVPTAISNFGKSIVGHTIATDSFGGQTESISVWTLASPTSVTLNYYGYPYSPDGDLNVQIASDDVPITAKNFYAFTSFTYAAFPTTTCAITNFLARAINDSGTIVGTGGGDAAYGSTTTCAQPIASLRPANGFSDAHGINSAGDLLVSITGSAAPAFGAEYLVKRGLLLRIGLPATSPSSTEYLVSRGISDGDEVVGDIRSQSPPFAPVAPFLYRDGTSIDLNSRLPRHSGWTLLTAAGVSSGGKVIGTGYHNGVLSGYALQP